jgi:hypothetical protein
VARIDSVANNFAAHVTSGLSGFITAAYDASVRLACPQLRVTVLGQTAASVTLPDAELQDAVDRLRGKFVSILRAETEMSEDDVELVSVAVDFAPDAQLVEQRRAYLAGVPVYYGYDPVYECTVVVQLRSGARRAVTVRDQ